MIILVKRVLPIDLQRVHCTYKALPPGFTIFTVSVANGPIIDTSISCIVESTGISTLKASWFSELLFVIVTCRIMDNKYVPFKSDGLTQAVDITAKHLSVCCDSHEAIGHTGAALTPFTAGAFLKMTSGHQVTTLTRGGLRPWANKRHERHQRLRNWRRKLKKVLQ